MSDSAKEVQELPKATPAAKATRAALQVIGGAVPFASGLFSVAAGTWSENEQKKVNDFFHQWIKMIEDELHEKERTILEIMTRLDIHEEEIAKRLDSKEYKSLLKKTFREWSAAESEDKRIYIRNILANAAATSVTSDEVVGLFIDWLKTYSEFHFKVISAIYRGGTSGISRGSIWKELGKKPVEESSADADLFKLLIRDLSTGGMIRQHREKDIYGNFVPKPKTPRQSGGGQKPLVSAFDDIELYELTDLGKQFVHYAMTDLPLKIEYKPRTKKGV